jgi:hypothetical protein
MAVIGTLFMWLAFKTKGIRPLFSSNTPPVPISPVGRTLIFVMGLILLLKAMSLLFHITFLLLQ